ncbi:MAG: hypothetical protein ABW252_17100 [Polyangiales bacterium]
MSSRIEVLALALTLTALCAPGVAAQANAAEMNAFPMPPPTGYVATKTFAYAGDFGYFTAPMPSEYGTGVGAPDYRYVRYRGINGKRIYAYGAWGPTPITMDGSGDGCGHAHASYGVWIRYEISLGFTRIAGWVRVGGGAMSGVRESGRCVFKTNGPLAQVDARFGWGSDFFLLDCRQNKCGIYTDMVLGALSNTHGWGSCTVPRGSFAACKEPSYLISYTTPL